MQCHPTYLFQDAEHIETNESDRYPFNDYEGTLSIKCCLTCKVPHFDYVLCYLMFCNIIYTVLDQFDDSIIEEDLDGMDMFDDSTFAGI